MKSRHVILYITGFGDEKPNLQQCTVSFWKLYGAIKPELFLSNWSRQTSFSAKLDLLLARVDALHNSGHLVSLVGVSAGASLALTAFALRKNIISGVVCLCGKINHPETVHEWYYTQSPAFKTGMKQLNGHMSTLTATDRQRIRSIHPLYDQTVPVKDTYIQGADNSLIPTIGHVPSIALGISIFSYKIINFLKKQATIKL